MSINKNKYQDLLNELGTEVTLVAVSKTKPLEDIQELYTLGQRDFGENYVQELVEKARQLPGDIRWHFIGHLQSNKVKLIAPFVQLIQSIDSLKLLEEVNKQAGKNNRVIDVLLQVHIAEEESKFGFNEEELVAVLPVLSQMHSVRLRGLMGMATFTEDEEKLKKEFSYLRGLFKKYISFPGGILSMGMSSDHQLAIKEGSNMVRVGSLIFGERIA
jgi:pyridoxal phosphate enzyme (YggS family)